MNSNSLPGYAARVMRRGALGLALLSAPFCTLADEALSVEQQLTRSVTAKLGVPVTLVSPSPIAGIYEVVADNRVFYVSEDGQYLLHGHLFDMDAGFKDLTELRGNGLRLDAIGSLDETDMVIFPAEQAKHVITIFTDVDCGYCQKLHQEIADYNDQGITVRYLGFPRAGLQSESYTKLESIWCADDQQTAMTLAKQRKIIPELSCQTQIPQQYELGQQLGVNGTPTMILEDGSMIPGYVPADRLAKMLDEKS